MRKNNSLEQEVGSIRKAQKLDRHQQQCLELKQHAALEKITKTDELIEEFAKHAQIIRVNAQRVGRDVPCYR